jgi:cysteine-rich repeat protein
MQLIPLLVALAAASAAGATTADDVCSPLADPCVVPTGTTIDVTDGSVLDFGTRALVLAAGGASTRLDGNGGSMTILAGSVTLNPGSGILSRSGSVTVISTGAISVLRSGNARARIDVGDFSSPGTITLDADGDLEIQGVVTAQGAGAEAGNGSVALTSLGDVRISGEVNASSGGADFGGDVNVQVPQGDLLVSGFVDASGGIGGGTIEMVAAGSITTVAVNGASRIDARADGSEGDGGAIDLSAVNGDLVLEIPLFTQGSPGTDLGGSGGDVTIDAGGSVVLGSTVDLSGAVPDGDGGDLDVWAGLDLVHTGEAASRGRDQTGVGGAIDLFARRMLTVGPADVSGTCATCSGGDILATAWCGVTVPSGVQLRADGAAGGVQLRSGDGMAVHGNVTAGQAIEVFYRDAADPPDLTGATFSPAPLVEVRPLLVPCGGPIANCGNGQLNAGEGCDDANRADCDGCSANCQLEACGNGRLGCNQQGQVEACDDGNTVACDGCSANCTRRDDVCGDGVAECGEECDTGPAVDCDAGGCSAQCQDEFCQNGRAECGEQCDDGAPTETCSEQCQSIVPATCGDGNHDPTEGCDDANLTDCDGCSHLCQLEACGNGTTECAEECDDFNTSSCDGCSGSCAVEACGNQIVDCGEECDEGDENGRPGSSCLGCRFAPVCTPEVVGACIPCLQPVDCDPLGRCGGVDCIDDVCTPDPIDCSSDDPCEEGSCHVSDGCRFDPVLGFDSVRCRLSDIQTTLADESVSERAQVGLGKLLGKAQAKVDAAEAAFEAGSTKRVGRAFSAARRKLIRLGKKVVKLQPKQITDPGVGGELSDLAGDAVRRVDGLRGDLVP